MRNGSTNPNEWVYCQTKTTIYVLYYIVNIFLLGYKFSWSLLWNLATAQKLKVYSTKQSISCWKYFKSNTTSANNVSERDVAGEQQLFSIISNHK